MKNYFNYFTKIFLINFIYKIKNVREKEIKYNNELNTYWEDEEKR